MCSTTSVLSTALDVESFKKSAIKHSNFVKWELPKNAKNSLGDPFRELIYQQKPIPTNKKHPVGWRTRYCSKHAWAQRKNTVIYMETCVEGTIEKSNKNEEAWQEIVADNTIINQNIPNLYATSDSSSPEVEG